MNGKWLRTMNENNKTNVIFIVLFNIQILMSIMMMAMVMVTMIMQSMVLLLVLTALLLAKQKRLRFEELNIIEINEPYEV